MESKITSLVQWLNDSDQFKLAPHLRVNESDESGRGIVFIEGALKKNEIIVSVPGTHQLNFHTVLHHISKFNRTLKIPRVTTSHEQIDKQEMSDPRYKAYNVLSQTFLLNLSSFQLLALYILAEWVLLPFWSHGQVKSFWEPFFAVWPTQEELKSFPAIWSCSKKSAYKHLLQLLPSASEKHMIKLSKLMENDWAIISPIITEWDNLFSANAELPKNDELFEEFLHIYCIINSRCLYKEVPLKKHDLSSQFTMVPFVDFLNHTPEVDVHCYPFKHSLRKDVYSLGPFTIKCGNHTYKLPGEEILLNYGAHSNDFLINEYGFVIRQNNWDSVDISKQVCAMITDDAMVQFLKINDYWEDYTINMTGISYRVVVAMSLAVTGDYKKTEKLLLGLISEDYFFPKIKDSLCVILLRLRENFVQTIQFLERERDTCTQNLLTIFQQYVEIIDRNLSRIRK